MRFLLLAVLVLAGCASDEPPAVPSAEAPAPQERIRDVAVPSGAGAATPRLVLTPDGRPFLSWTEPESDGYALVYAAWENGGWAAPTVVASGENWVINGADTPGVLPGTDGHVTAFWLEQHPEGGHAYDVVLSQSDDSGATWSDPTLLNTDGVAAEHGFVAGQSSPDGTVLAWLDGRAYATTGTTMLRAVLLAPDGSRSDESVLDPRVCDCCPTAMAQTSSGPILAFRDRSEREIRDIAIMRLVDGAWSEPTLVHADGWEIAGCPVNGPALAAEGDRVAVAWFTGADDRPRVLLALSLDGGLTFSDPIEIDEGRPMGRVSLALGADYAAVTWLEEGDAGVTLYLRRLALDTLEPSGLDTLATTQDGQSLGIPRVLAYEDSLLVAWTDADTATLHTVRLPF